MAAAFSMACRLGKRQVLCILTGHGLKVPNATVDYHSKGRADAAQPAFANPPVEPGPS